jgi:hypothetical protein
VAWVPNSDDGGSVITSYVVRFLHSDGTTLTTLNGCDGSDLVTISNSYCEVAMNSLTSIPYSLALGADIFVEVSAVNVIGEGLPKRNTA